MPQDQKQMAVKWLLSAGDVVFFSAFPYETPLMNNWQCQFSCHTDWWTTAVPLLPDTGSTGEILSSVQQLFLFLFIKHLAYTLQLEAVANDDLQLAIRPCLASMICSCTITEICMWQLCPFRQADLNLLWLCGRFLVIAVRLQWIEWIEVIWEAKCFL